MTKRGRFRTACAVGALTSVVAARSAMAAPEWNSGLVAGVAGTGTNEVWSKTHFAGAVRGDALFGRARNGDFGVGPAVEVGTVGFSDLRLGGGVTALLPLTDLMAVAVTPAASAHFVSGVVEAGFSGRVFVGARSVNFTGRYALAAGILLGFDQDFGGAREHVFTVAAQIDAAVLALPVVLLIGWIRGPSN